ncbi:CbtA family protein [Pseudomonas oryzihabitans]|uniref:CbtA family protein n=1 Tax=Pseudomonas oryzihabitans TaxID=47885 RepID=UPI00214E1569|nr:CbtA family protein [Pseudomonas psychrotolerans]UUW72945.1 CbtA family protein [Pseudomonas psychrotolerans]
MFQRIAFSAGVAGLLAALLLSILQSAWMTPLILQAETYEVQTEAPATAEHQDHGEEEAWAPADGWPRTLSTFGGNLVVAVGFGMVLAGLFNLRAPNRTYQGLLWGLAGYATFCLAPSLGLPPELPGTAAADLTLRQAWWIGTAGATAAALALLAFARHPGFKIAALGLLVIPLLLGAPQPVAHESLAPQELQRHFQIAVLVSNLPFWLLLGLACSWLFCRQEPQG